MESNEQSNPGSDEPEVNAPAGDPEAGEDPSASDDQPQDATPGDQGEQAPTGAEGFDPNAPRAVSPPDPSQQSGEVNLDDPEPQAPAQTASTSTDRAERPGTEADPEGDE